MTQKRKPGARRRRQRRPPLPRVTPAQVQAFLDSPTARRWYAFSDSNVKRFVIRALWDLLDEIEQLERAQAARRNPDNGNGDSEAVPARSWTGRVNGRRGG